MPRLKRLKETHSYQKDTVYGRLTLTGVTFMRAMYGQMVRVVEAFCDCGTSGHFLFKRLTAGDTKSCGCLRSDTARDRMTTHGLSRHPLYEVHRSMQKRCYIEESPAYKDYGGRGIEICDEWVDDFVAFYEWAVENGYQSGLSIDRKDNDKGYSPDNCHFTNRETQSRNNRRNKMITAFGETKCLFDWGKDERCKVGVWGLRSRFDRGTWTDMEAMISSPGETDRKKVSHNLKTNVRITAFGETKCMAEWLEDERCLVKIDAIRDRIKKGWDGERILTTPPHSSGKKGIVFLK
jgi:hypothetical protein